MAEQQELHEEERTRLKETADRTAEDLKHKNIYYLGTLRELEMLEDKIEAVSLSVGLDIGRTIEQAGIRSPADMLDDAIAYWDEKLQENALPPESELIRRLSEDFKVKIKKSAKPYIPTDQLDIPEGDNANVRPRLETDVNRVSQALRAILELQMNGAPVLLDDIDLSVSAVPVETWRDRPYWAINLTKLNIVVLVNNQYGNRSFVVGYKSKAQLKRVLQSTKEILKSNPEKGSFIHHFEYHDADQFQSQLKKSIRDVVAQIEFSKPYPTLAEASEAAQALGIKSAPDYSKRRRQDQRLPGSPHHFYKDTWTNWYDFLGKEKREFYTTFEEAKAAAQALGIQSQEDYRTKYKKDSQLPANPWAIYGENFTDWGDFLHNETHRHYATLAEAKEAAAALGVNSAPEYWEKRSADPLLPSSPDVSYKKEWISWFDFLDKPTLYDSYQEARESAIALGCNTSKEYTSRFKSDPRLPRYPYRTYKEEWKGWDDFLGRDA